MSILRFLWRILAWPLDTLWAACWPQGTVPRKWRRRK